MGKSPLTKTTTVNIQGNTTTMKTVVPSIVRDVLELEHKDKIIWELNPKKLEVTLRKLEN